MTCSEKPDDVPLSESLEVSECPCGVPGSPHHTLAVSDSVTGQLFTYDQCAHCGLEYLNPRPTREAIGAYYPDNYYAYDPGVVKPERFIRFVERLIYSVFHAPACERSTVIGILRYPLMLLLLPLRKRTLLAFRQPSTKRVFEIGAAMGRDLLMFREAGWEATGCEPSEQACKISRSHGLDVQNCQAEQAILRESFFSCVLMNNVFEHLHEPESVLAKCHDALIDDGVLLLVVPNHASWSSRFFQADWPGYDPPRHLWGFTPSSLTNILRKHGFRVESIHHKGPMRWCWRAILERRQASCRAGRWERRLSRILDTLALPLGFLAAFCRKGDFMKVVARKGL